MEQHRQSDQHKLTPTQLYDALAVFRTPGQDLLHDLTVNELHLLGHVVLCRDCKRVQVLI